MGEWEKRSVLAVRLLSLSIIVFGAISLAAALADSVGEFNPAYLRHYFMTELLRPLLWLASGIVLRLVARPLGRRLARGLDD
ncbi:MAG: hypothetical protein ACFBZ8_01330 [Opitutales bacterium]